MCFVAATGCKANEVVRDVGIGQHYNPVERELAAGVMSCPLHLRAACRHGFGTANAVQDRKRAKACH
jgi:hypothetical protein